MTTFADIRVSHLDRPSATPPAPRVADPITLTIFGATGDLTHRKLMPALFAMYCEGYMPEQFAILGFARRDYDDDSFRLWIAESIREHNRLQTDEKKLERFCSHLFYHRGDLQDQEAFVAFRARLRNTDTFPCNHLFYLSVAPGFFESVIESLATGGLIQPPRCASWSRVVIEKPFGKDLASARLLNEVVRTRLDESQIFRIDHYLGKETVQNILSFRFANAIFEPLFRSEHIDHIEITASETVGMEKGRGGYYDATGCLRDMVQNHLLQLLCLVAMEPPANLTADAIRNEKVKVLQSIVPLNSASLASSVVRGQYTAGTLDGEPVPGYREEERVAADSMTESFVGLRLQIANWRWSGVPIYLRTGKRMAVRRTEIRVHFKIPPLELFQTVACVGDVCDLTHTQANVLVFRIQPNEGISLQFAAKRPTLQLQVESVAMDFDYSETWERSLPGAYERLLLDAMRGDSTLFTRSDEVETAWGILEPILKGWSGTDEIAMHHYQAGSWGPAKASSLIQGGDDWSNG
jgi:glucose-6-phosphate 1-dehydrogenase